MHLIKSDITTREDIVLFVDNFYNKVRLDDLIGPVFNNAIADWAPHLEKMYAFWNAALFGVAGFKGNPFAKHAPLPIGSAHFDRWILLFNQTIDESFEGTMANETKKRAGLMGAMFLSRLQGLNGGDYNRVIV